MYTRVANEMQIYYSYSWLYSVPYGHVYGGPYGRLYGQLYTRLYGELYRSLKLTSRYMQG